ncbi:MAG: SpoVG family protein [Oscillospiraceae bacterium]|nr:SpoVG family protein [Oscillospiraceae bacterium]
MQVTDIKIRKTFNEGNVKAVVSVTLDDFIAIHEIKVVQGNGRIFAAMPNRLDSNDVYRDIVHPISAEARDKLERVILKAYENYIELFAQTEA